MNSNFIKSAVCLIAAASLSFSCKQQESPDGKCEISSFALTAALNSSLGADVNGIIDAQANTITLVIPESVSETSFIPTFTATDYDVVEIGGVKLVSGQTSVSISDGTKVSVRDDVSVLSAEYTICVKADDGAAELVSVVFKAADNSQLSEDVCPAAIEPEMVVRVPAAAFRTELVLTVDAGQNDVIEVNNTEVAGGSSIKVDTSFPVDIVVSDPVAGKRTAYVLKVGKILDYVVTKLATYSEGTINDFTMTLNPSEDVPYIAYTRKLDGESNNGVSVAKWNGTSFALVGATGIADASARSASKPQVAFAADGTVYASYMAGDVASKPTVKKLDSDWVTVGTAGITPQNANTSYYYPLFVHPSNSRVSFFWCGNTKDTDTYRTIAFAQYNGSDWSTNKVSGPVPVYGVGASSSAGMYYTSSAVVTDSKVYIASSFNQYGYYVHEVAADGTLSAIVENYLPAGAEHGLPANVMLLIGGDGQLYMFGADRPAGTMQLFTVDASAKTLLPYGAGIPVTISSSGGINQDASVGINPVDGQIIAAYDNAEGNPEFLLLDVEGGYQWSKLAVDAAPAAKSAYGIVFDSKGNGFVAYVSDGVVEVFRVGLEPDELPE